MVFVVGDFQMGLSVDVLFVADEVVCLFLSFPFNSQAPLLRSTPGPACLGKSPVVATEQ